MMPLVGLIVGEDGEWFDLSINLSIMAWGTHRARRSLLPPRSARQARDCRFLGHRDLASVRSPGVCTLDEQSHDLPLWGTDSYTSTSTLLTARTWRGRIGGLQRHCEW